MRTEQNLPRLRASVLGPDAGVAGATGVATIDSLPGVMWEAPAEALEVCLATLVERHGSVVAPLHLSGLSTDVLRRLGLRFVEGTTLP